MRASLALATTLLTACADAVAPGDHRISSPVGAHTALQPITDWSVTLLTKAGYNYAKAWAINDSGTVVGTAGKTGDNLSRFAWKWRDGLLTTLPIPEQGASARGINNKGEIVGLVGDEDNLSDQVGPGSRGWYRSADGNAFNWLSVKLKDGTAAWDINDSSQVVGGANVALGLPSAHQWARVNNGWQPTPLGPQGEYVYALHLNNAGRAAGFLSSPPATPLQAMTFQVGQPSILLAADTAMAADINNAGYVVGHRESGGVRTAWYWWGLFSGSLNFEVAFAEIVVSDRFRVAATTPAGRAVTQRNGVQVTLPLPQGATSSGALGINSCGVIVGYVRFPGQLGMYPAQWKRVSGGVERCD